MSAFFFYNRTVEKIQFLVIENCPDGVPAWHNLLESLNELKLHIQPEWIIIHDDLEADHHSFQGCPSIKVDGKDLWPVERSEYHMGHRAYVTAQGTKKYPSVEMLIKRISEITEQEKLPNQVTRREI